MSLTRTATRRCAVTMLLLGDITVDARVIKMVRSLSDDGHQVTVFCLTGARSPAALPDLRGAEVRWVTAPRPLAGLRALLARRADRASVTRREPGTPQAPQPVRMGPAATLRAFIGTIWLNLCLASTAASLAADVIHCNDLDTLTAGVLLRRRHRARLIYDAHELYPDMMAATSPLYRGLWLLLEHRLIRFADAVLTVNDSLASELAHRHKLSVRPTVVMNCPPIVPLPAEQVSGVENEEYLILYQGHLNPERGLEALIDAVPLMDRRVAVCLRGAGRLRSALEQRAVDLGVADRVRLLDAIPPDQLVTALTGFTIGVIPYVPASLNTYLSTPNKLFEYLMGGLPIVATDLPEVRRLVDATRAGETYPASHPDALAEVVNRLVSDPQRLQAYRHAARRSAMERYNWEAQEHAIRCAYAQTCK